MNLKENQPKLVLLFLFFILSISIYAQVPISSQTDLDMDVSAIKFWKVDPINGNDLKEIKEWRNYGDGKIVLGDHYKFISGGLLASALITDGYEEKEFYVGYTSGERFLWIKQYEQYDSFTYNFAYVKKRDVVEMNFEDIRRKTFYYKDKKGRVIEKKEFVKNVAKKEPYRLSSRIVYNYNSKGDLFGEMHYSHPLNDSPSSKKVIHRYDPDSGLKIKTFWYDEDEMIRESDHFFYNKKGQLKNIKHKRGSIVDFIVSEMFFSYQNDKLLKKVTKHYLSGKPGKVNLEETEVYKNGRLVYRKISVAGGAMVESNYQYITF